MKRFNLGQNRKGAEVYLASLDGNIEIDTVKNTRTSQQNKALHLFFTILCQQMNEIGMEHTFLGIKGNEISIPYTPFLVKQFIWKQIQVAMFGIESTTKINTEQINQILDVLTKHFGEMNIEISFPNKFDEYLKFSQWTEK